MAITINPTTGPREGGTEVRVISPAADMSACNDDFADGSLSAIWTDTSTGTGFARERLDDPVIELSTGVTAGSTAGLRTVATPNDLDASITIEIETATIPFASSLLVFGELAIVVDPTPSSETDFRIRVEATGGGRQARVIARIGGQTVLNQFTVIGSVGLGTDVAQGAVATFRLLRTGNRVLAFANETTLVDATWVPDAGAVGFQVLNDPTDDSYVLARARSYLRLPVVVFGTEPMTTITFQGDDRVVGLTPAVPDAQCGDPLVVDINIEGCGGATDSAADAFTYTLDPERIRFTQGTQRALIVCNDPVLRRRRS